MSKEIGKVGVLFVDDEELSRKYFKRFFGRNYEVFCAEDGQAGLEVFFANKDKIGIIVSDQMMPIMTGLELLEAARKQDDDVVRVLSTAYADSEEVAAAINSKLVEYFISKPWDLPILEETLAQAKVQSLKQVEPAA